MSYEDALKREALGHGVELTDEDVERLMLREDVQLSRAMWEKQNQNQQV